MPFDPTQHLILLQKKEYLEVKWRLVWLREAQPEAVITTEIVAMDVAAEWAVIRATVTLPGGASATGMALQRPTPIARDFIANGETSAIGRALAALGFGTQHAIEFDQGDQVVDAPVTRSSPVAASTGAAVPPVPATEDQRAGYLRSMAGVGFQPPVAEDMARHLTGQPFAEIERAGLVGVYRAAHAGRLVLVDGTWRELEAPPAPATQPR